jgi:dUTP pyrophosphatase
MKANIPENNLPKTVINSPKQAQEAAQRYIIKADALQANRENLLISAMEEIKNLNPNLGGFDEIAVLLTLPEDKFALLAPIFLAELEKSFNNSNDQLAMAQALNITGQKIEDLEAQYIALCEEIDNQLANNLSTQKRDFLKNIMGLSYNSAFAAEGIAKRHITIPIEYCRPDAKMPTYAHLTDAGMDVYLTEDITIHPGETKLIPLGIKCAVPLGYELQVRPKSGRSLKSKLRIANTPGTIDSGYRDEICVIADNIDPVIRSAELDENGRLCNILWGSDITLEKGEKIAQLVLSEVPKVIFYEVENVSSIENDGRKGGFGSTGDK